jgi:hypothetical protein
MSTFTLSVAALAIATFASAKPITARVDAKTGFTVYESVAVAKQAGPVALANAVKKYGGTPPPAVAAAAASGTGTVAADPEQYDSEYLCQSCRMLSYSEIQWLMNVTRCRRHRWTDLES